MRRRRVLGLATQPDAIVRLQNKFEYPERKLDTQPFARAGGGGGIIPTVAANDASEEMKAAATFVCDGTDDQEEMQTALIDADGGWVVLSDGTFTISDGMTYPDTNDKPLLFTGMGHSTIIHFDAAGGSPASRVMLSISGGDKNDVHIIRDMRFTTETDADTATKAIFIQAWALIQGVRFDDTTEEQILVFGDTDNPKALTITNCLFFNGVQHIEVNRGSCIISENYFLSASSVAIRVESPNQDDGLIFQNKFSGNNADITTGITGQYTAAHNVFDDVHDAGDHTGLSVAGSDSTAIHDDTASEISAIAEKTSPVAADLVVIEDSAAANVKKRVQVSNLLWGDGSELTIAAGEITVTTGFHTVDTQADDATDELDTINGGATGQLLILASADDARDPTLTDGVGNLRLAGNFTLTDTDDTITLIYDGSNWLEVSRSDNA